MYVCIKSIYVCMRKMSPKYILMWFPMGIQGQVIRPLYAVLHNSLTFFAEANTEN